VHLELQCKSGTCDTKHGPEGCISGFAQVEAEGLRSALARRDLPELVRLADDYPEQVLINEERKAVQIASCDGAVVAHLPVESRLLDALVRAMAD
jgi:hypothetical protein